jgi:hypothetical protein
MSALERIVGTVAGTLPLAASIILDKHFGYAMGAGLWGLLVICWVWNANVGKGKTEA